MRNNLISVMGMVFLMGLTLKTYAETAVTVDDRARLGEVYSLERLRQYTQAMPTIEALHQRYANNREILWTYVRVLGFGGHWKQATVAFDQLCAVRCDEDMFVTYAHILEAQGPDPQTLPYIKKLADQHPDQKKIQSIWVEILSWNAQNPKAHQAIKDLSARYPQDLKIVQALGDIAYAAKDYALAQKGYEKVLEKNTSAGVLRKYADTLIKEKKYADAIAQMDKLLSSNPHDKALRYEHAQVVAAAGEHQQAVKELQALIKDGFTNKEAVIMLGDELRLLGRNEEALKVYGEVANEK